MCHFRSIAVTCALLLLALSAPAAATAQDTERDARAAVATAEELFALADARKFNAMYDRIHPDAHQIIPRVVAVRAFEDIYAAAQAGRAQIVGVELVSWSWGVTGKRYDDAAAVSFEQPYVENGQERILEDTMYLVPSGGEWRWFFGSSPEFVEAAIRAYGEDQAFESITSGNLVERSVQDLEAYYTDAFGYTNLDYDTPGVVAVGPGERVQTACGPATAGFWAFYCPPDATIYLEAEFLDQVARQADFAAAFVIAHEWAHHVQTEIGLVRTSAPDEWNEVYSIELELMADCLSGVWALDLDTRGLLEHDDIDETVEFTMQYLGDPEHTDVFDPQAHGTAEQRANAILSGYQNGFEGCNIQV
jgi:predicted metalloprotease